MRNPSLGAASAHQIPFSGHGVAHSISLTSSRSVPGRAFVERAEDTITVIIQSTGGSMRNSAISLLQIKELFSPFFIVTSSDECRVSVTLINSSLIPGQEAQSGASSWKISRLSSGGER
jgi:hypothetical protein